MKTDTLTDKTWYRCRGVAGSYIVPPVGADPNGPRCCLGNVVRQEGITGLPANMSELDRVDATGRLTPELLALARTGPQAIYTANDWPDIEGGARVGDEALNALTRPCGFQFIWADDALANATKQETP